MHAGCGSTCLRYRVGRGPVRALRSHYNPGREDCIQMFDSITQRVMLIVGMLLVATLLHIRFCDWMLGEKVPPTLYGGSAVVLGWEVETTEPYVQPADRRPRSTAALRATGQNMVIKWGIVAERGRSVEDAIVYGTATPSLLLLFVLVLIVGIRSHRRRARGACLKCGYELHFNYDAGCPECGWRRERI